MSAIVDSHVHFWNPSQFRYDWLEQIAPLNRPFVPRDLQQAAAGVDLAGVVFVQADCAPDQGLAEARWVASLTRQPRRSRGSSPSPRSNRARRRATALDALAQIPLVKGIRRLIQSEASGFALQASFVAGVRLLADYDLPFDLCVLHHQLPDVIALVERCPDVRFVLDHLGKPGIADGEIDIWRQNISRLAQFENVSCKLSGLVTEADHAKWQPADLRPYVEHALEAFGAERLMFGSDYPICTLAGHLHTLARNAHGIARGAARRTKSSRFSREMRPVSTGSKPNSQGDQP